MEDVYEFADWYNYKASDIEKQFADKVSEYELLFDDMIFSNDDYEFCIPDEIRYYDITQVRFKVEELTDLYGYYNSKEKVICINADSIKDTPTILHEMIHLYEETLNDYRYLHDILYWNLYTDLRKRIPRLDSIITEQATTIDQIDILSTGGTHDIVFLLKSFDLDIRMGYTLGTVFSYGRQDDFKEYSYKSAIKELK